MARNKPRKLKKAASERFRLSGADGNDESGADGNEKSGADGNEESGADVNGGKINFNASDASDMHGKEKNNEAYRKHSVISFIICEVLADVAAVALILLGRTGAERYGSASVPATDDTTDAGQENAATFDENGDGENRGFTVEPTEEVSDTPFPQGETLAHVKTTVIADGSPIATLASGSAAEELIEAVRTYFDGFVNKSGAVTSFLNEIDFVEADENAAVMPYDEAFAFLTGSSTPLRVQSRLIEHEFVTIPYEVSTVNSSDFYCGTRFVAEYGRNGKKMSAYEYIYINGTLQSSRMLESEYLDLPLKETVIIGTRPRPAANGITTGEYPASGIAFARPVDAAVVRFFGLLNGSMHEGVDFAANRGENCKAAAAGTVVAVLERGSMGLTVYVRHENGFATVYAGLEKAHVSVGTTVAAGDIIGTAGADGIHFGIYANGVPCDPKAYISGLTQ